MEVLSRRSVLAIAAVVDVALYSNKLPVRSKALAARQRLPPRRLEPLLQALVHAEILSAERGPYGGYRLNRAPRLVSLGDIVRASLAVGAPPPPDEPSSPLVRNFIEPAVREVAGVLIGSLDLISVEDVCSLARNNDAAALTTH